MRHLLAAAAAFLLIAPAAQASVPTTTTGNATAVTQTTATLHGTVKPNGANTTWHFEIGPTTGYGSATAEQGPVAAGSGSTAVSADVGALAPGTVYHYRLAATNASGTTFGKDRTFTTRPAVSLNANKTIGKFNENIILSGQIFGGVVAGITVTLQENPYPFTGWSDVATATSDAGGRYQFVRALRTNTAWRVVAGTKPTGTSNTAFVLQQDTVSLKLSNSRPKRGRSVLFTGFATPGRVGGPVSIQRLTRRGWRTVLNARLAVTPIPDTVSYSVRLRRAVSGLYRAVVPGGYDHLGATSRSKRIRVRH